MKIPRFPAPFGLSALLAFLGILGWQGNGSLAVWIHLMLAAGAMPLILSAMIYFTPVLTRSGTEPLGIHWLPVLAMLSGMIAVTALLRLDWRIGVAAPLAWAVALAVLGWMSRRAAKTFGSPHPCLYWYMASTGALLLGLMAILAGWMWPEWWDVGRRIHRHLNLLGFVGLAAIGTLEVLLPTVGGYADLQAARRLRLDLKFALLGVALITIGTTFDQWWWSAFGAALWGWVVSGLLRPLESHVRRLTHHGAAFSLLAALGGFCITLVSPLWHAGGVDLSLFLTVFLFPLVMGALTHLLPMWWWPGMPTAERNQAQHRLGRFVLLRVGLCWLAWATMQSGLPEWGGGMAGVVLMLYCGQVIWALGSARRSVWHPSA